jgi:hypothetical protein
LVKFSSSFIKRTVKNIDLYQRPLTADCNWYQRATFIIALLGVLLYKYLYPYTNILYLISFHEKGIYWLFPFIIIWHRDLYLLLFKSLLWHINHIINKNDINWLFLYWSRHRILVSTKGGPIQLMLWVRTTLMPRCTTLCHLVQSRKLLLEHNKELLQFLHIYYIV